MGEVVSTPVDAKQESPIAGQREKRRWTSREDGMSNFVAAALELLWKVDPQELTVRQIGERAGHSHRFVQAWFGGKAELFGVVWPLMVDEFTQRVVDPNTPHTPFTDEPSPELERLVRMMVWLSHHRPETFTDSGEFRLVNFFETSYSSAGVDPETSRLLAQRLFAGVIAYILFPEALRIQEGDFARQISLESRIVSALANPEA